MRNRRSRKRKYRIGSALYPATDPIVKMALDYNPNRPPEEHMADHVLPPPDLDHPPAIAIPPGMARAAYPDWSPATSRIVRRPRAALQYSQSKADRWAAENLPRVLQTLHTSTYFAWRVPA